MNGPNPFRHFKTSPEVIRLEAKTYIRFPSPLKKVGDLLHERGIDIDYETVRLWRNRSGPMFAAEIRQKRVGRLRAFSNWCRHIGGIFVEINRAAALAEWRQLSAARSPTFRGKPRLARIGLRAPLFHCLWLRAEIS